MKREIITPKDKEHWLAERAKDITSTEVSALFGLSPYTTEFEVWHRHQKNEIHTIDENERMKWGTRLESAIAEGVGQDNNWTVKPFKDYVRIPELQMGASFDYKIFESLAMTAPKVLALLEVKNVDALQFKEKWEFGDDGELEAPLHIEMQVQYQMLVSDVAEAYIAALVGGNTVHLLKRQVDQDIAKSIQEKVFEFWASIRKGKAPDPDFNRDAKFISKLYQSVSKDSIIESTTDDRIHCLAEQYKVASDAEKAAKEQKQAAKAEMLTLIGEANKVKGDGFSISAGMIGAKDYHVNTEPYRDFRVFFKKQKGAINE